MREQQRENSGCLKRTKGGTEREREEPDKQKPFGAFHLESSLGQTSIPSTYDSRKHIIPFEWAVIDSGGKEVAYKQFIIMIKA